MATKPRNAEPEPTTIGDDAPPGAIYVRDSDGQLLRRLRYEVDCFERRHPGRRLTVPELVRALCYAGLQSPQVMRQVGLDPKLGGPL